MLHDCGIPVVLLDRTIETTKYTTITIDDEEAGREAASYLMDRGHTRIVGVFGDQRQRISSMRLRGFRRAHAERSLPLGDSQIIRITMMDDLEAQLERAFAEYPDISAIFTMTDDLLVHTHHLLARRGSRIPEDVSLMAISDGQAPTLPPSQRHAPPPLGHRGRRAHRAHPHRDDQAQLRRHDGRAHPHDARRDGVGRRSHATGQATRGALTTLRDAMSLATFLLFAQLAAPLAPARPVLTFPERGLDDTAAYAGYQTRLFRDAAGNTLQIYLDSRAQRVVHLWADAEDESIGFTARADGRPAALSWASDARARRPRADARASSSTRSSPTIRASSSGGSCSARCASSATSSTAAGRSRRSPSAPFVVAETDRLLAALARLEPAERSRQLGAAPRHQPGRAPRAARADRRSWSDAARASGGRPSMVRVVQPSLDALDTLSLELRADPTSRRASRRRATR